MRPKVTERPFVPLCLVLSLLFASLIQIVVTPGVLSIPMARVVQFMDKHRIWCSWIIYLAFSFVLAYNKEGRIRVILLKQLEGLTSPVKRGHHHSG